MNSVEVESGLAAARALCSALCPPGVVIDVRADDSRTAFVPAENVILIARQYLAGAPAVALGAVSHEIGHVLATRYHLWKRPAEVHEPLWLNALNAFEETRVHRLLCARLPGILRYLRALFDADPPDAIGFESCVLAFLYAAATWDRRPVTSVLAGHAAAREAFAGTEPARHRYAAALPPASLLPAADAPDRFARLAVPLLDRPVEPDALEAEVLAAAAAAHGVFLAELWPVVEALAGRDRDRIATALGASGELLREGRALAGNPAGAAVARKAFAMVLPDAKVDRDAAFEHAACAAALLRRYLEDPPQRREIMLAEGPPPAGAPAVADDQALETALREALPPQRRRWAGGWNAGPRLDLGRVMRAQAQGRVSARIWQRREETRPKLASLLLVDLSGSMAGEKIEAAIAATSALSRALGRIAGISWGVMGFQDVVIPVVPFGETSGEARIQAMRDEVAGTAVGAAANNNPRYNDDGPCLLEAAAALAARPEPDKLLLVLSDGQPAGQRSSSKDLKAAVARIQAEGAISLVGLGIGANTGHVREYYPTSQADIALPALAEVIGQLVAGRVR